MIKKIFIASFLFLSLAFITKVSFSQEIYFCEGVTDNGKPTGESSTFNIPSGGGYFYFLVRLPYNLNCYSVDYELYKVDTYNNTETYNTTISQDDMGKDWTWFWKKVTFYKTGYYHVYVKDCNGYTLTDGYVTVNWN